MKKTSQQLEQQNQIDNENNENKENKENHPFYTIQLCIIRKYKGEDGQKRETKMKFQNTFNTLNKCESIQIQMKEQIIQRLQKKSQKWIDENCTPNDKVKIQSLKCFY